MLRALGLGQTKMEVPVDGVKGEARRAFVLGGKRRQLTCAWTLRAASRRSSVSMA